MPRRPDPQPLLPDLLRVSAHGSASRAAGALRARAGRGELTALAPGVFVSSEALRRCDARQRHVLRAVARVPRLHPRVAASHWSAAALLGLPALGGWPRAVHVVDPARTRTQSAPTLVRHAAPLGEDEVVVVHGVRTTSPSRTVVDLALAAEYTDAVGVLDAALHHGLVDEHEVAELLDERARRGSRGVPGARRALDFARAETESPGESLTRVDLHLLGAPVPVLQHEFVLSRGRARVDFWLPDQGVVLEFDGEVKYTDPVMLAGRSPREVVAAERRRDNEIRREHHDVRAIVRLVWSEVASLARFRAVLLGAGVPCRR